MACPDTPWRAIRDCLEEHRDGHLVVGTVTAGFFHEWNAAHADARVRCGDRIVTVNGVAVDEQQLQLLQRERGRLHVQTLGLTRECPNTRQLEVLRRVARRVSCEWLEEREDTTASSTEDPLLELVHGLPGTGKSKVIAWQRELFEEVLGWTHGVQFVCLAFQNKMAADINGLTVHRWSGIPAQDNSEERRSKPADIDVLAIRCQSLRWIIIDEISMVSAELMGELEKRVSQAVAGVNAYKRRPDGSLRPHRRYKLDHVRRQHSATSCQGDGVIRSAILW